MNKVSKNIVFLPIKAWFLGRKLFQQPYYLVWLNNGKMSIKSGEAPGPPSRHSEDVDVKAIAQAVWVRWVFFDADNMANLIFVVRASRGSAPE